MENSMGSAMASTAPQDQISALIQQVADENGLEIKAQLENTPVGTGTLVTEQAGPSREDDLERRFVAISLSSYSVFNYYKIEDLFIKKLMILKNNNICFFRLRAMRGALQN